MRNIIGPLHDNVICKYDLKGSTINRETNLDLENVVNIVMKDNNFIDIEHYLFMDKSEINRLRRNTMSDGYFLNEMELMDYSLFLVKISLTKEEIKEVFGDEEINDFCEKNRNLNSVERKSTVNIYINTEDSFNFNESNSNNFLKTESDNTGEEINDKENVIKNDEYNKNVKF